MQVTTTPAEVRTFTGRDLAVAAWKATGRKLVHATARDEAVTLQRMTPAELAEWAWLTSDWEGRTSGDLGGWVVYDANGDELGILLSRGRICHGEWKSWEANDYVAATEGRTLQIALNYIVDEREGARRRAKAEAKWRAISHPQQYWNEDDEEFAARMAYVAQRRMELGLTA